LRRKRAARYKPGVYVLIPEKYYLTDTSELRYTVKPGSQPHDIILE